MPPPKVLTIAGSDSGGGAGIQADLKTFEAHGVFGCCVITAITAQNTVAVTAVHNVPCRIIAAQMDAVFSDLKPDAVKIGMLSNKEIIKTVAKGLKRYQPRHIVLDPVMVAASGARLLEESAIDALKRELFPLATIITPNIPEAEVILGPTIKTPKDMKTVIKRMLALGCNAVLMKGGHLQGKGVTDIFSNGKNTFAITNTKINKEGHGTGCTLSSAIAANLALGCNLQDAVRRAVAYVHQALAAGYHVGASSVCVLKHRN